MPPRNSSPRVLLIAVLLVSLSEPGWTLPKGLAELSPITVTVPPPVRSRHHPDIREMPPEIRMAGSGEEWAAEVGAHVGRVASSWSEGTSVPLLGPVVRGFVRAGQTAYRFRETMESRYGVVVRPVGREGVAVMMRRRF